MKQIIIALVALAAAGVLPVQAQSQADFVKAFSGKWQVYDQQAATGTALCELDFSRTGGARLPVKATGCKAPLANVQTWSIEGSQLVLDDAQNAEIIKLGGNQKRITGATSSGLPVILERAGGDANAATLQAAYNASGCYYLGYTQTCAPRSELAVPGPGADGRTQIELQVNLNVHSEPRADANLVGATKQGTCVQVQQCTMASDGPWCEAKFGNVTGWLRKLTMRQNRWPVVTFTNSCKS